MVSIADSNGSMPVTAVIGPAGISLVPDTVTVSRTLSAAGSPPEVVPTEPVAVGGVLFKELGFNFSASFT